MCGIAGYIGSRTIDKNVIHRTLNMMQSRGPDNKAYIEKKIKKKKVILLHSRLSIIDLEKRSNQPFTKDNFTITFNGEIYNYIELKNSLIKLGHFFQTNSDTEVIVETFKRYGEKCVDFFEGMWAFAIFDSTKKTTFISRDRLGEKPLFYLNLDNEFFFGSETKFILSLLNKRLDINYEKVKKFIVCGYRSIFKSKDSFIKNIKEFEASTNYCINHDLKIKKSTYWKINYKPSFNKENDIYEQTLSLLCDSLKIRMRSDVPLAFCMSGGVDSTSLVCLANKYLNKSVKTFSVIDSDKRYDEKKNIDITTNYLNCNNSLIKTTNLNFFDNLKRITEYYNSPVPTISYYIHNQLIEKIREQGFLVSVSGTGADEIFSGYYDHYLFWLSEFSDSKNFSKLRSDWENGYGKYVNNPLLKNHNTFIKNPNFRNHLYQSSNIFKSILIDDIDDEFKEKNFCRDLMRNRMLNELSDEIVPTILYSDDLNSMMYSVENRSPFLDSKLIEFLFSVPTKYLIKNGFQKYILRESVKDFIPKKIYNDKKKVGFNASIKSFLNLKDPRNIDWLLQDSSIFELINKKKFEKLLKKDFLKNEFSKFLFNFITSKIFIDSYKKLLN